MLEQAVFWDSSHDARLIETEMPCLRMMTRLSFNLKCPWDYSLTYPYFLSILQLDQCPPTPGYTGAKINCNRSPCLTVPTITSFCGPLLACWVPCPGSPCWMSSTCTRFLLQPGQHARQVAGLPVGPAHPRGPRLALGDLPPHPPLPPHPHSLPVTPHRVPRLLVIPRA